MNVRPEVLALIVGCMLVTIVPRVLPLLGAHRLRLPPIVVAWLGYVPVSVISALFFSEVLLVDGALPATVLDRMLLAGIATLVLGFATRSIAVTVVGGILIDALLAIPLSP